MNKILEINNLLFEWKKKDSFRLLVKSFCIKEKTKVLMFGESGTGKSTLLNLISGILNPVSGNIIVENTSINKLSQKEKDRFRANNIGVIFQQFNIIDHMPPLMNILLPCFFTKFKKKNKKYFYERTFNLSEKLGIKKNILLKKNSKELSVGQKQRVAIMRAIINHPRLILADEPTSALDNTNKRKFLDLLINTCDKEKITLLMVSHDTSLKKYFDKNLNIENLINKNANSV